MMSDTERAYVEFIGSILVGLILSALGVWLLVQINPLI